MRYTRKHSLKLVTETKRLSPKDKPTAHGNDERSTMSKGSGVRDQGSGVSVGVGDFLNYIRCGRC